MLFDSIQPFYFYFYTESKQSESKQNLGFKKPKNIVVQNKT